MKLFKYINFILLAVLLSSCAAKTIKATAFKEIYEQKPASVIVMPPINKTTNVEAKEYFYNTLGYEIAEDGYYVFPQFITMELLKEESAYDSELFVDRNDLGIFNQMFGADLILFTTIHKWSKSHIGGKVTVDVEYTLKSSKDTSILYNRRGNVLVDTSVSTGGGGLAGLAVSMLATAISTANTEYVDVAKIANSYTLQTLPKGKYHPNYGLDGNEKILVKEPKTIKLNTKFVRKEVVY